MANEQNLLTLTEISKRTKISMPTLQRYKKAFQARIPSEGKGRSQRYPEEAVAIFLELKKENIGRRGRPRKADSERKPAAKKSAPRKTKKAAPKKAAAAESKDSGLLTLTQVGKLTKISYPTLLRYVKDHLPEIPHQGEGRNRRYLPEAVDVFRKLRGGSRGGAKSGRKKAASKKRPGRPAKATTTVMTAAAGADTAHLESRIKDLEKQLKSFERTLGKLEKKIEKPFRVVLQRK